MSVRAEREVRRFTVDEVERMVEAGIIREDEPLELLEGELVVVSPQGPPHASVTSLLHDAVRDAYRGAFAVREAKPMVAGPRGLPEPDIAVFRGTQRDFLSRHPRGDEAVLVVEVAHTSHAEDHEKAAVYARAGVPVYWLLDLPNRRLEVYAAPLADEGRYALVRLLREDEEVELPALDVRWRVATLLP